VTQTEALWRRLRAGGYAAVRDVRPASAAAAAYLAFVALGHDDVPRAAELMRLAAQRAPDNELFAASAACLAGSPQDEGGRSVYAAADGFRAFIRSGGNVLLYAAVSAALRGVYDGYDRVSLLDLGVGDGRALVPALGPSVTDITLVEPSADLLTAARSRLDEARVPYRAHETTAQAFVGRAAGQWDVAQATFSLQSLPPAERMGVLGWLAGHAGRLLVVEFDVPAFTDRFHPAFVRSVLDRFRRGLLEYGEDRRLVGEGFLLPVMFGFFRTGAERTNYEAPLETWGAQVRSAGFTHVEMRTLCDYWWGPAFLIDARGSGPPHEA
jgi:hypothetical protein